jgi:hypothetical protein
MTSPAAAGARRALWLAPCALLISAVVFAWIGRNNEQYLERFVPYGDVSSYYSNQIQSYMRVASGGALAESEWQLKNNIRDPLRGMLFAVAAPAWLISVNGYLMFHALAFALFVALLGAWAFERGWGRLQYGFAVAFLLVGRYTFDPVRGMGAIYPDQAAAFLYGSAVIALLRSRGQDAGWALAFGVLACLTAMARTVAGGYLLFLALPIVAWFWWDAGREAGGRRRFWIAAGCAVLPALLCLPWVLYIGQILLLFYMKAGYSLGNVWELVGITFERGLGWRIGRPGMLAGGLLAIAVAWQMRYAGRARWSDIAVSLWLLAGHLVLIGLVLRVGDDWLALTYYVPLCAIVIAAPYRREDAAKDAPRAPRALAWFRAGIGVLMFALVARSAAPGVVSHSDRQFEEFYNSIMQQVGPLLSAVQPAVRAPTLEMSFWEYGRFVIVGALRREQLLVHWAKHFQVHRDQWEMGYPNVPAEKVAATLAGKLLEDADIYVTLADKRAERVKVLYVSDLSIDYVTRVDELIARAPASWRLCRSFDTWFGKVLAYVNLARAGDAVPRMQCVQDAKP